MQLDSLAAAIADDIADGVVPLAVVATAGTTLTGTVDPIAAIADICSQRGVWLHVDGAYGVPAAATSGAGELFAGLDRADSLTVDAHKWLGVPKSCSAVLFRDRGSLVTAFGHHERYMLHEGDVSNPVDRTFEYSRPLNSLRLWMAFRIHGAAQYRDWIEGTLGHARALTEMIDASPAFELLHAPMLSTVCFRHLPAGVTDLDAHNARLARAMQTDGRVFLAAAVLDGMTCPARVLRQLSHPRRRGRVGARGRRGARRRARRRRDPRAEVCRSRSGPGPCARRANSPRAQPARVPCGPLRRPGGSFALREPVTVPVGDFARPRQRRRHPGLLGLTADP